MEIKPGMRVRLKTQEELLNGGAIVGINGGISHAAWGDSITSDMLTYLGTVVTVAFVRRAVVTIIEDSGEWNWLPVWVDEIVSDGAEALPAPTLRLTMYEQFREKGYFFCIMDEPPTAPKRGWSIQLENVHTPNHHDVFKDETPQGAWNKVVAWLTSIESF